MKKPKEPMFPILISGFRFEEMARSARQEDCPLIVLMIPWAMIAPHEKRAMTNHSQTLRRLAERGGLNAAETVAVLEDRRYSVMTFGASHNRLREMLLEWEAARYIAARKESHEHQMGARYQG